MKTIILTIILLISTNSFANNLLSPEIQHNVPETIFIPEGFTTLDNSQIVFEGMLSSSCYKSGYLFQKIDHESKNIYFEDSVHFFDFEVCLRVVTFFMKEPRLGQLQEGTYSVNFKDEEGYWVKKGEIKVSKATVFNFDQNIYAPVNHINFIRKTKDSGPKLIILGELSNQCMKIDKIETHLQADQNVMTIKPIVKISDEIECGLANEPVQYKKEVDLSSYSEGRYLFRVKTLNGRVINKLVSID